VLLEHLGKQFESWDVLVTTMTIHGRDFARDHLGPDITCYLAPLDVPFVAARVARRIDPDLYICLETEVWPLLISHLHRTGTLPILLNGRLSEQSISGYLRLKFLFGPVLRKFDRIGAISDADRGRFIEVGALPDRVTVTGNIKNDRRPPADRAAVAARWTSVLCVEPGTTVVVCGSTHPPEEELLLPLYREMTAGHDQLWLLAPRHLDRLDDIVALLDAAGVPFDRLSTVTRTGERHAHLVLVDTFGDLPELFSVATFVFIGGTLAPFGGHNLMEAAMWETIVFFGPDISDFRESGALLEACGGGYRVASVDELGEKMEQFLQDPERLHEMRLCAGQAATGLRGAGSRQAEIVSETIEKQAGI